MNIPEPSPELRIIGQRLHEPLVLQQQLSELFSQKLRGGEYPISREKNDYVKRVAAEIGVTVDERTQPVHALLCFLEHTSGPVALPFINPPKGRFDPFPMAHHFANRLVSRTVFGELALNRMLDYWSLYVCHDDTKGKFIGFAQSFLRGTQEFSFDQKRTAAAAFLQKPAMAGIDLIVASDFPVDTLYDLRTGKQYVFDNSMR